MGPIGSRQSCLRFCIAAFVCVAGCAHKNAPPLTASTPPAAAPPTAPAVTTAAAEPSEQLPDGAGRQILMSACTACHGLREVTKFRGFYVRQQWKDIVLTMVDYGAPVGEKEIEVLADYLAQNLGKK